LTFADAVPPHPTASVTIKAAPTRPDKTSLVTLRDTFGGLPLLESLIRLDVVDAVWDFGNRLLGASLAVLNMQNGRVSTRRGGVTPARDRRRLPKA
jgi:hypothetical protein